MVEEEINLKEDAKKFWKKTSLFLKQKKVQNILVIIALLAIIVLGTWIRVQNLPLLKDSTTGEYIPLALDPFYFLRVSETLHNNSGVLPEFDNLRILEGGVNFIPEILPQAIVILYKISNLFGNYTLQYIDVLSPVIFFILGIIAFFFLVYFLTKSKSTALLGSFFLTVIPSYLYRTMAGFSDHESIGMIGFFLTLLVYAISLNYLETNNKLKNKEIFKTILFGFGTGFLTAFTMAGWGGISNFLFMIIPLCFFIFWLIQFQKNKETTSMPKLILFYATWIISTIISGKILGYGAFTFINKFLYSIYGLFGLFVLVFILIDFFLERKKKIFKSIKTNFRQVYSFFVSLILGIIGLLFLGKNPLSLITGIWDSLLHPFGLGRVGLTVAENAQPYLMDWIGQTGKFFFWMFLLGLLFVGFEMSKGIKGKKEKVILFLSWIILVSGIIFSRVSASSLLNGTNFISQGIYIFGLLFFGYFFVKFYFTKEINLNSKIVLIASWSFLMIISGRSAVRFFFVLAPFFCFLSSFFVIKTFEYFKKSKEELIKILLLLIILFAVIGSIYFSFGFFTSSFNQAKYTGPSANYQWQNAMEWVRENTPPRSIFVHWWDYGYWVEYLGKRPTLADGGHFQGEFRNHLIGRYILTTPFPETALSFMKSNKVDYLLIDPTDLGKYPAYSKIGSGEDGEDRYSQIPIMLVNDAQSQETKEGLVRFYQGGTFVDEDIVYGENESKIFLPYEKSFIGGLILEERDNSLLQPKGIFVYNNQQILIPIRFVEIKGELVDFKGGLNATIKIIPKVIQNSQGAKIEELGVAIYLSPKVSESLFAQLYLLNDPFNKYDTIKLSHSEQAQIVSYFNSQGASLGEFVYYNGFQGPIKIWEVKYPENILEKEEFLRTNGDWAEFDDLQFISN